MLLGAAGEIWDVVKNLLAVGFSTGISKAVFAPAAVFGKCWLGFVLSGRMERSWGQIYPVTSVCCILGIPNSEPHCTPKCPLQGSLGVAVRFAASAARPGCCWSSVELCGGRFPLGDPKSWVQPGSLTCHPEHTPSCCSEEPCVTLLKPTNVCWFGEEF